jgi:hypothetical protein
VLPLLPRESSTHSFTRKGFKLSVIFVLWGKIYMASSIVFSVKDCTNVRLRIYNMNMNYQYNTSVEYLALLMIKKTQFIVISIEILITIKELVAR